MTSVSSTIDNARDHVEDAVREARPALKWLARLGFVAKGCVYITIGVLATQAAIGSGGSTTNARGALRTILHQPFGRTMLAVAGAGLLGFALWRLIQALLDPENEHGTRPKELGRRGARLISGFAYGGLGVAAWQMVVYGARDDSGRTREWTTTVMAQPAGAWLLAAIGVGVFGTGAWYLYRAWTTKLGDKLVLDRWGAKMRTWIIRFGRAGYAARGIVFCLIGGFMVAAARHHDAGDAKGVGEALQHVSGMRYGWLMLGAIALGLIAYGVFQLVEARYRKIELS
ncbi:MAG TPA: DUF1206 domain-containing protein [Tepidisphaeraceae bacterium]|nr:DUF1206 domain-containing protein [Tepidisphaeraceae bacterium]